MLLSIIIPVYNVEQYLAKCLDSVLACNLADCEIILSLGSSDDNSDLISKAYQEQYPIIRLLRQDGRGLSNARNCAAREAKGSYILFLDSDDYVDSEVLSCVIGRLHSGTYSSDVIVTDYRRVEYPSKKMVPCFQIGVETPDQTDMTFLPQMLKKRQCFWNVWRYIYRRGFLEENQISFPENMLSEDVNFTTSVFLAEPEILFTHSPFYIYNVGRGGSLMDQLTVQRLEQTVYVISDSIERLRKSAFAYADTMIAQYQFEYILNIAIAMEVSKADRQDALALFKDYNEVLRGSKDPVIICFRTFICCSGIAASAKLLHMAKILRRRIRRGKTGREK